MKYPLTEIRHNPNGFDTLIRLFAVYASFRFTTIEIDMTKTTWFDADMCAPFGAILYRLGSQGNRISLTQLKPKVERILTKNGFLTHYGRAALPDTYGTTIPYQRFDVKDDRFFAAYVENKFVRRTEMPKMSVASRNVFGKVCLKFSVMRSSTHKPHLEYLAADNFSRKEVSSIFPLRIWASVYTVMSRNMWDWICQRTRRLPGLRKDGTPQSGAPFPEDLV